MQDASQSAIQLVKLEHVRGIGVAAMRYLVEDALGMFVPVPRIERYIGPIELEILRAAEEFYVALRCPIIPRKRASGISMCFATGVKAKHRSSGVPTIDDRSHCKPRA